MDAVRADGLGRDFGGRGAVGELDLRVAEGEVYGLVGPDGAGKTTVLRMLAGILRPHRGRAVVLGHDVAREPEAVKRGTGYMSQRFGLYPDLTVLENLRFYADIYLVPRRERAERIERLLSFSNLAPFSLRLAGRLSGGMKQKLGLACALVSTPRLLLLDEPTNGVDPVSRRDFWRILTRLNRDGVSILLSTAYLDEAERCHRVGLLDRGRLLAEGEPAELRRLVPGTMLEVRAADPRRAARRLAEAAPDLAPDLIGDRVRVVVPEEEAGAARIRETLAGEEIGVREIRRVAPSLESVFVSVLGREGGDA